MPSSKRSATTTKNDSMMQDSQNISEPEGSDDSASSTDLLDPFISVDPTLSTTLGSSGVRMPRVAITKENMVHMLRALDEKMLSSATQCLEAFIRAHSKRKSSTDPREYFGVTQVILTAKVLHRKITKSRITFLQFREYLENLAYLFDLFAKQGHETRFSKELRSLVFIVENLASHLERCSGKSPTDWIEVAKLFPTGTLLLSQNGPHDDLTPVLNHIKPIEKLSESKFGNLYEARLADSVPCALRLTPIAQAAVYQGKLDCVACCMTNSPFIVEYFASFVTVTTGVLIQEYLHGAKLHRVLMFQRQIDEDFLKLLLGQLVLAIEHLHHRGIIWRDLKPSNILLLMNGRLKLTNLESCKICLGRFTPCRLKTFDRSTPFEFDDNEIFGTFPFIAPEVLQKSFYGRSIDWWSLGVTAYQLYFGKLPFKCLQTVEAAKQLKILPSVSYEGTPISEKLKSLMKALLVQKPARRLCSVSYTEVRKHSFFSDVTWADLVQNESLKDCRAIVEAARKEVHVSKDLEGVRIEELTSKKSRYFRYISPGFERALAKISKNMKPSLDDLFDPVEPYTEDVNYRYKFRDFQKNRKKSLEKRPSSTGSESEDVLSSDRVDAMTSDTNVFISFVRNLRKKAL